MRKTIILGIFLLILLIAISCGCIGDENSESNNESGKTGEIAVNFHVEEDSTTNFELYIDDELVSEKSQLMLGTYKWSRKANIGTHTIQLIYYWEDWLGTDSDTLTETFTLNTGQTKTIDWYDEMSPVDDESYEEEDDTIF